MRRVDLYRELAGLNAARYAEWTPAFTGDGASLAFIGATAQRPPLPAVMPAGGGQAKWIAEDRIPADFPTTQLVVPRSVTFEAADGKTV